MNKIEIGVIITIALAIIAGAIGFGRFEGRLSSLEKDSIYGKELLKEGIVSFNAEADEYLMKLKELQGDLDKTIEGTPRLIMENSKSILSLKQSHKALGENSCKWMHYVTRGEPENIAFCPDGSYMKGLGFKHAGGQNFTHQMSYRLYCCSLK